MKFPIKLKDELNKVLLTRLNEIVCILQRRWRCWTGTMATCSCHYRRRLCRWRQRVHYNATRTVFFQTLHPLLFQFLLDFVDFFCKQVVVFLLSQNKPQTTEYISNKKQDVATALHTEVMHQVE